MKSETHKPWKGLIAALLLTVPIFYVLSAGPAAWLYVNKHIERFTFIDIYLPVAAVVYKFDVMGEMMNSYISYFGGFKAVFMFRFAPYIRRDE